MNEKSLRTNERQKRPRKVETGVRAYIKAHQDEWISLVRECVSNDSEAMAEYDKRFGPQAIANWISERAGGKCSRQAVGQTAFYEMNIKPPREGKLPAHWDELGRETYLHKVNERIASLRAKGIPDGE